MEKVLIDRDKLEDIKKEVRELKKIVEKGIKFLASKKEESKILEKKITS